MSSTQKRKRHTRRSWSRRKGVSSALLSATCVFACSVYDSSLLRRSAGISTSQGGSMSIPMNEEAGGTSSSNGGAPTDDTAGAAGGEDIGGAAGTTIDDAGGGDASVGGYAGSTVEVSYGGGGAVPSSGGQGGSLSLGGTAAGGAAGRMATSSAGAAGAPPVLRELAKGKSVTASSRQTGNEPAKGNDKDEKTRWCAFDKTLPQWWRVDLGASHPVTQVVIHWEHADRKYTYTIETSANDSVYTQQAIVNGTGSVHSIDLPPNVNARYVRITVTATTVSANMNAAGWQTWASFYEFSVNGY